MRDDAADGAGFDQVAGGDGGGLRVVLGIADREDAAGLGLHAAQLGELVERGGARLVEHHVLAGRMARTAIGARSLRMPAPTTSLTSPSSRMARSSVTRVASGNAFSEVGGEIVLGREERLQVAAGLLHDLDLTVDVTVIDADDGKRETGRGSHSVGTLSNMDQRLRAPRATPRMMRRWKARKTAKTGISDSADMANIGP